MGVLNFTIYTLAFGGSWVLRRVTYPGLLLAEAVNPYAFLDVTEPDGGFRNSEPVPAN